MLSRWRISHQYHIGIKTNIADFFGNIAKENNIFDSQRILKVIPIISILFGNIEIETVSVHDIKNIATQPISTIGRWNFDIDIPDNIWKYWKKKPILQKPLRNIEVNIDIVKWACKYWYDNKYCSIILAIL